MSHWNAKTPADPYRNGGLVPETPSGVHRSLVHTQKQIKFGAVILGIVALGSIGAGWLVVMQVSQAKAQEVVAPLDGGLRNTNTRLDFVAAELARHILEESSHHERQERKADQLDQKLDVVLDYMRVPMSKRPDRADGGQ